MNLEKEKAMNVQHGYQRLHALADVTKLPLFPRRSCDENFENFRKACLCSSLHLHKTHTISRQMLDKIKKQAFELVGHPDGSIPRDETTKDQSLFPGWCTHDPVGTNQTLPTCGRTARV